MKNRHQLKVSVGRGGLHLSVLTRICAKGYDCSHVPWVSHHSSSRWECGKNRAFNEKTYYVDVWIWKMLSSQTTAWKKGELFSKYVSLLSCYRPVWVQGEDFPYLDRHCSSRRHSAKRPSSIPRSFLLASYPWGRLYRSTGSRLYFEHSVVNFLPALI